MQISSPVYRGFNASCDNLMISLNTLFTLIIGLQQLLGKSGRTRSGRQPARSALTSIQLSYALRSHERLYLPPLQPCGFLYTPSAYQWRYYKLPSWACSPNHPSTSSSIARTKSRRGGRSSSSSRTLPTRRLNSTFHSLRKAKEMAKRNDCFVEN